MYFIGVTRFSLFDPSSKAWRLSKISEQDYIEKLYSDERLSIRFDIFINRALPLYEEMSKDFFYKHIIQYSSHMPDFWKNKLFEETKNYDFVILSESKESIEPLPITKILEGQESGTLAYFRVDDDDLLSIEYLKLLSKYSKKEFEGMVVSFGKGSVAIYDNGRFLDFRQCHKRVLALGMAFIGRYNAKENSYWLPAISKHETIDTKVPVIMDSRNDVFIWTQNIYQDTKHFAADRVKQVYSMVSRYKPLNDTKYLKKLFPTISNDIDDAYKKRDTVLSLSNIKLDQSLNHFNATTSNKVFHYLVSYEVIQDSSAKVIDNLRAMTLSFNFDSQPEYVEGLALSNKENIGWFSYVSIRDGVSNHNFIISLDAPNKLDSITINNYHIKENVIFDINELRITEIGNIF